MKKYRNIIIIVVVILAVVIGLNMDKIDISDILLALHYYDTKIEVLSTADIHGHILYDDITGGYYTPEEVDVVMGMPLVKSLVDRERKKNPDCILLDSGDMFHGTNEANVKAAEAVVELANMLGYTALTLGNHDFNFGIDRLFAISKALNFPFLSANIYYKDKLMFQEYKIVERNGKRIGIFGLTTRDFFYHLKNEERKDFRLEDPVESARRVVAALKTQTDMIILVSHLGDEMEKSVAAAVDGIDLVLGGHFHNIGKKIEKIGNTCFGRAGSYTNYLGIAQIYFKAGKIKTIQWKVVKTKDTGKEDPGAKEIVRQYHALALKDAEEIIGRTDVNLDGLRSHVRTRETNLANLLADAMQATGNADIALINGGVIRQGIRKGEITLYNVKRTLPFYNSLIVLEMTGADIYSVLEHGIKAISTSNGAFLQAAGIAYEFDGTRMAGERVLQARVNNEELKRDARYSVATNDYLFNGGDDFREFKQSKIIKRGGLLCDVLSDYIRQKKILNPAIENRITVKKSRYK